jgi:hypothetical protein
LFTLQSACFWRVFESSTSTGENKRTLLSLTEEEIKCASSARRTVTSN